MTAGQAAALALQAGYFVALARALGATGLGQLAGALAIVMLLVPFAGLGMGNVLVRDVARRPEAMSASLGAALLVTLASGIVLVGVAVLIALLVPSLGVGLVVLLAVAELVFGRLPVLAGQAFQALEKLRSTAALGLVLPALRTAGAVTFAVIVAAPTPTDWAIWYIVAAAVAAVLCLRILVSRIGRPTWSRRMSLSNIRAGLSFSIAHSAALAHADIDKVMLARLSTADAVGIYAAAYRATALAVAPILALVAATYARFFACGTNGLRSTLSFARRLLPPTLVYGLAASAALLALAPALPMVLGDSFDESTQALRWLAAIPPLQALVYLGGDALTGANQQGTRTALVVGALGLNIGLNLILIPAHSWRGSAWATLASLLVLAASLWAAALVKSRCERRQAVDGLATAHRIR